MASAIAPPAESPPITMVEAAVARRRGPCCRTYDSALQPSSIQAGAVLRRPPVLDEEHGRTGREGQRARERPMRVEIPVTAAPMEVDDASVGIGSRRTTQ